MTRIILLGYGAMGKALEQAAAANDCSVVGTYDVDGPFSADNAPDFDVAIDFSIPTAVIGNARAILALGKPLVIGTTGWAEHLEEITQLAFDNNTAVVHGSNFSIGVQLFFRIIEQAAALVNSEPSYDPSIQEWHHTRKVDSPSGTALSAAEILLKQFDAKSHIETETQHNAIKPDALHVTSARTGNIVGTHQVQMNGPHDSIEIKHTANSRDGFVKGALKAASWINGKTGVYDFRDVVMDVLKGDT